MAEAFVSQSFVVQSENGLHIRPAEQLSRLANQFSAQIGLVYQSQRVDAKSIMEMLTLGAAQGAKVQIEARGPDAHEAVEAILTFMQNNWTMPEPGTPEDAPIDGAPSGGTSSEEGAS